MRIALLTGARKNAGDFLIVERTKQLLCAAYPACEIVDFDRSVPLEPRLEELNACDVALFAGGPGYARTMYPKQFPLVDDLARITPPLFALGMGAWTRTPSQKGYGCTRQTRMLLDRIAADGFGFGCRDLLSMRVLHAWGYKDTVVTGCPAWYDVRHIDEKGFAQPPTAEPMRIAVSDPGNPYNAPFAQTLVEKLRATFPRAELTLVFNRGWNKDAFTGALVAQSANGLRLWAEARGVGVADISHGSEGFARYAEHDLHIGFRVHTHLFMLSQRRPSVLIEEDGRGYGANEVLGLPHFGTWPRSTAEDVWRRGLKKLAGRPPAPSSTELTVFQHALDKRLESALGHANGPFGELVGAFEVMRSHYPIMREHIGRAGSHTSG